MTTLDSAQSQTVDAKKLHPDAHPAGSDATHEHETKKADAPVGGGFVATTWAELKHVFSHDKDKQAVSDGHTLTIPPLDSKAAEAAKVADKPTGAVQAHATVEKPSVAGEKAPAVGEKAPEKLPVQATAEKPVLIASVENPAATADNKAVQLKAGDASPTPNTEVNGVPKPPASESWTQSVKGLLKGGFEEYVAPHLSEAVAKTVESVGADVWHGTANVASDLIENADVVSGMVQTTTAKDGTKSYSIDADKASQAVDMQAMKNVFQGGANGAEHQAQTNKMFDQAGTAAAAGSETAAYKALDAQRSQFIAEGHKNGTSWSDKTGTYSLDKQGNLLEVTGTEATRDIKWVGTAGQSYERDPAGHETWTKDGREIQQLGKDEFKYTDAQGNTADLNTKAGITVREVATGTITSFNQNRVALDRAESAKIKDGFITNPNGLGFSDRDVDGNQFIKDSMRAGQSIYAKDGHDYRVHGGQVYEDDANGVEHKVEKLPTFIKRNADGTLEFHDIKINKDDSIVKAGNNAHIADRATTGTAGAAAHQTTVSASNGNQVVAVKGEFTSTTHTDAKTGATTTEQRDGQGKPEFNYNWQSGTMRGDGITFTKEGSHIQGSNFAISRSGQIEAASSWMSANRSYGINDASDSYVPPSYYSSDSSSDYSSGDQTNTDGSGDGSSDSSNSGSGDGSQTDANQLNADGSPEGDNDPDDSYKAFDHEKEREEKTLDRITKTWDEWKTKLEGKEDKEALREGFEGKPQFKFDIPPALKLNLVAKQVNVGEIQGVAKEVAAGGARLGDIGSLEVAKAELGEASSKFGFDGDGYMARLDGLEKKVEERLTGKVLLDEHKAAANAERLRFAHEYGSHAGSEVEQRETA